MAILKCKMCGGDLRPADGMTTIECEYCGTIQTIPRIDDSRMENLFNRANHFRRLNEFDKAISAYDRLLDEDNSNAEAHWGIVLSRYGIEYVEDPMTHERIPTCHRVQLASILSDSDYLEALENAPDHASRELYEKEAHRIAEIQRDILAISEKEKPYDVFICYKETDEDGNRTKDSAFAQEVYYQLTNEGYKVFFARITLEDKLGHQYEPYIFAALNSARVMLVIGTTPEYFNAVWVRNEWSRYLALMKKDRSRLLIPCYRDMDPYDLPEALSALQSQDMAKIGFIQDLIHGIKKVLTVKPKEEPVAANLENAAFDNIRVEALYKRATFFLEDGDFDRAERYCERMLDMNPEYAPAYVIALCIDLKLHSEEEIPKQTVSIKDNSNYKRAVRFALPKQREILQAYSIAIENSEQKKSKDIIECLEKKAKQMSNVSDMYDYVSKIDTDWARELSPILYKQAYISRVYGGNGYKDAIIEIDRFMAKKGLK